MLEFVDTGFRRNVKKEGLLTFYDFIKAVFLNLLTGVDNPVEEIEFSFYGYLAGRIRKNRKKY